METTRKSALHRAVMLFDGATVVLSMLVAFGLHALLRDIVPGLKDPPRFTEYAALAYLILPVWLFLILQFRLDRIFDRIVPWTDVASGLIKLHASGVVAVAVLAFLTQSVINRTLVALFFVCTFSLMLTGRLALARWLRFQHGTGQGEHRILLGGAPSTEMAAFVRDALADPFAPRIVGHFSTTTAEDSLAVPEAGARLGSVEDLERIIHEEAVDEVLLFPPLDRLDSLGRSLDAVQTQGIPVSFSLRVEGPSEAPPRLSSFYGRPFITLDVSPKAPEALAVKHAIDVVTAAVGLLLLAPLLLAIALAVLVMMGRPVFFVQERAGLHGRRFQMFKFRTMVSNAEQARKGLQSRNEMSGPVFKITGDPRITPLGHWLRRASLDELPQLVNVLLGSMSLVGPRPLPVDEQQRIRGWHRRRLSMKPGITGLWQISGRNDVDFEEWMKLDLRYVDEWSLWLDAYILARTVPAVLLGTGSR